MSLSDNVKIEHGYDSDTSEVTSKPFRPLSPDLSPVKRRRLCLPAALPAASTSVHQFMDEIPTPAADEEEDELDFPSSPSGSSESGYDDDDENNGTDEADNTNPADYVASTVGLAPRAHPRDRLDDRYIMRYTTVYPPKALRIARIREKSELFRKWRARISKVRCLAPPRPKRPDGSVRWHQAKKWAKMRKWSGQNKTWIQADLCRMWICLLRCCKLPGRCGYPSRIKFVVLMYRMAEDNVLDGVRVHFALKRQSWTMVERMVSRVVWKFGG